MGGRGKRRPEEVEGRKASEKLRLRFDSFPSHTDTEVEGRGGRRGEATEADRARGSSAQLAVFL